MIYLDSAATSLLKPDTVGRNMMRAMRTMASPGRGGHAPAMGAADLVFSCRQAASEFFNVNDAEHIVFTMNATHALNIAINSLVKKQSKVLISGFEHNSVTRPLVARGAEIRVVGRKLFDVDSVLLDFEKNIKWAELVVCTHVSNVFGFILPIYEIAEICRRNSVPLIIDASQSAGVLPIDANRLGAAFIAMPGHKGLLGPQGTGILICEQNPAPYMYGGSGSESISQKMPLFLPDRLEAGTHNVCGIAGLKAGIDYVKRKGTDSILRHEKMLLRHMVSELQNSGLELFAGNDENQCGVLSVRSEKIDCETLAVKLAKRGICVRSGIHCSPVAHESAGTIKTGTVRFSFSPFLTKEQIRISSALIKDILKRINS